jgi:hypothetical protein
LTGKEIHIAIAPTVRSRWAWLARAKYGLASLAIWAAYACIDVAVAFSDDLEIETSERRLGPWDPE